VIRRAIVDHQEFNATHRHVLLGQSGHGLFDETLVILRIN
jgi:hypothetical protein